MEPAMLILLEDAEFEITESNMDNEDAFGGRWGWFWHGPRHRPTGPFGSAAEAIFDIAERVAEQESRVPATGNGLLAQTFLTTAGHFFETADAHAGDVRMAEVVLSSCCYGLELTLKAYLLSRGRSDSWNRDNVRHDLAAAFREATFLGLPDEDARLRRFIRTVGEAYASHELLPLVAQHPNLVRDLDLMVVLRFLHREVTARLHPPKS